MEAFLHKKQDILVYYLDICITRLYIDTVSNAEDYMTDIVIKNGIYAKSPIKNKRFEMVFAPREGKKGMYVTVKGEPLGYADRNLRIFINSETDVTFMDGDKVIVEETVEVAPAETDEEIMDRMRKKFQILDGMTLAAIEGDVRAMIVTGPPGVGKSFGIEKVIESLDVMAKMGLHEGAVEPSSIGMEKVGAASALGLYQLLYEYSQPGSLLVLDDSDTVLYDEGGLNMLKAATDSGKTRKLTWRTESRILEDRGVPFEFEFEGAIIFVTNLDFENARGKIGEHLKALVSRCHYLDMGIANSHEKFLRCKQIVRDGMLTSYNFEPFQEVAILDYIFENQKDLRELSLRMVKKIADLVKMDPTGWMDYADQTCRRGRK